MRIGPSAAAGAQPRIGTQAGVQPGVASDLSYRPDVDGLRAVAILSVLTFHAFPHLLPGGFVGVDVFFVISGFLITGIIVKGLQRGSFTYSGFYARRIRRIFPALILVLLAIWGFGWLKFLPDEYGSLTKHIAAGSAYVSNIAFYKESGYFAQAAELKPLLHLWSLGVEEQFYIVWPLLLALTWRWRRVQLPALLTLAALSFAYSLAALHYRPMAAFYLPQARLWELATGGILAYIQATQLTANAESDRRESSQWWRSLLAGVGLTLLAVGFALIAPSRPFPGWLALLPVGGSACLIAAGERAWVNRILLASRPMVFVGLISYPLYLWHWPILSALRVVYADDLSAPALLTALATAFLLAFLTYRFVEVPIRSMTSLPRVAIPLFAALAVIGSLGYEAWAHESKPFSARFPVNEVVLARSELAFQGPRLERLGKMMVHRAGPREVLFIGDSNLEQYYPRIDELLTQDPQHAHTAVFATGGGCPPIPDVWEARHAYCEGLVDQAIAYARKPTVDTIVIGAAWDSYFHDLDSRYSYQVKDGAFNGTLLPDSEAAQRAFGSLERMLQQLSALHKHVVLILQIPVGDTLDPRRMIKRGLSTLQFNIDSPPLSRPAVAAEVAPLDSQLAAIAHRNGVELIDPLEYLCDPTQCPTLDSNGAPMYRDAGHLRPSYVRAHVHFLDTFVRSPAPVAAPTPTPTPAS